MRDVAAANVFMMARIVADEAGVSLTMLKADC
jgi:hypothetical protein